MWQKAAQKTQTLFFQQRRLLVPPRGESVKFFVVMMLHVAICVGREMGHVIANRYLLPGNVCSLFYSVKHVACSEHTLILITVENTLFSVPFVEE